MCPFVLRNKMENVQEVVSGSSVPEKANTQTTSESWTPSENRNEGQSGTLSTERGELQTVATEFLIAHGVVQNTRD